MNDIDNDNFINILKIIIYNHYHKLANNAAQSSTLDQLYNACNDNYDTNNIHLSHFKRLLTDHFRQIVQLKLKIQQHYLNLAATANNADTIQELGWNFRLYDWYGKIFKGEEWRGKRRGEIEGNDGKIEEEEEEEIKVDGENEGRKCSENEAGKNATKDEIEIKQTNDKEYERDLELISLQYNHLEISRGNFVFTTSILLFLLLLLLLLLLILLLLLLLFLLLLLLL